MTKHYKHDKEGYIANGEWSRPFQMPKSPLGRFVALATQPSTFKRTIGQSLARPLPPTNFRHKHV